MLVYLIVTKCWIKIVEDYVTVEKLGISTSSPGISVLSVDSVEMPGK